MEQHESVTQWINQLQTGDRDAAQKLWERYFEDIVRMARQKLRNAPRRAADEEDVAQVAFDSFFRRAEQGRFPNLLDRDQLWALLLTITERKAGKHIRHESQGKRDWRKAQSGNPSAEDSDTPLNDMQQLAGSEPTPEFAAQIAEECQHLLDKLDNEQLRHIAIGKMEGYTNEEIAAQLDCSIPTIERKLRLIRQCWEREFNADSDSE